MNTNSLALSLFSLLFCITMVHSQMKEHETGNVIWERVVKGVTDTAVKAALERWHTDSLGCLNLRTAEDSDLLIDVFGLDNATADSVVAVLGKPDRSYHSKYDDLQGNLVKATKFSYYFHSHCQGDSLLPESFIALIISDETGRVFRRAGGVH